MGLPRHPIWGNFFARLEPFDKIKVSGSDAFNKTKQRKLMFDLSSIPLVGMHSVIEHFNCSFVIYQSLKRRKKHEIIIWTKKKIIEEEDTEDNSPPVKPFCQIPCFCFLRNSKRVFRSRDSPGTFRSCKD